jgi:hypothetical protein
VALGNNPPAKKFQYPKGGSTTIPAFGKDESPSKFMLAKKNTQRITSSPKKDVKPVKTPKTTKTTAKESKSVKASKAAALDKFPKEEDLPDGDVPPIYDPEAVKTWVYPSKYYDGIEIVLEILLQYCNSISNTIFNMI